MATMRGDRIGKASRVVALAALLALLAACSRDRSPDPTPTPLADVAGLAADPASASDGFCANGRLRIGDLPAIDAALQDGLAEARAEAQAWRPDARLIRLQVGCRLLEPAVRWQATFFSPSDRSVLLTGSGETNPVDDDPASVQELPTDGLSFASLRRSLARAGYDDGLQLGAAGVTVGLNTERQPFGPPAAPRDAVYYHVAVEVSGTVDDLFVAVADGDVYRYEG